MNFYYFNTKPLCLSRKICFFRQRFSWSWGYQVEGSWYNFLYYQDIFIFCTSLFIKNEKFGCFL